MLKRILFFVCVVFGTIGAHPDTIDIDWIVDGTTYDSTTCTYGGDVTLPIAPTKTGYTFVGWRIDYTPIEYLQSTGTQYIDTGIEITNDTEFITKIGTSASNVQGIRTSQNGLIIWQTNSIIDFRYFYNGGMTTQPSGIRYSKDVLYDIGFNINQTSFIINGTLIQKNYDILPSGKIFTGFFDIIAYLKIYNNNSLVRDFIPVLDPNGVACMLDKVTQQFFYNAGTGDFIAGPVINE